MSSKQKKTEVPLIPQPVENESTGADSAAQEREACVMCGTLTDIPVSLDTEARKDYVEGCGQLCESCRRRLSRRI